MLSKLDRPIKFAGNIKVGDSIFWSSKLNWNTSPVMERNRWSFKAKEAPGNITKTQSIEFDPVSVWAVNTTVDDLTEFVVYDILDVGSDKVRVIAKAKYGPDVGLGWIMRTFNKESIVAIDRIAINLREAFSEQS